METLLQRITINPGVFKGKPTIRNMRFTVAEVLALLASGMSHEEILQDFPYLQEDDIKASLLFAQKVMESKEIIPIAK